MNVYWLAIDKNHGNATYEELQERCIAAQGWSDLGDLRTLCNLDIREKSLFTKVIQVLGNKAYEDENWWKDTASKESNAPTILWNLLNIKKGDLIVGIEGAQVRGVCQLKKDANTSYEYINGTEYSHCIGGSVNWVNWCKIRLGEPPKTSRQGIKGVRLMRNDRELVIKAWESIDENEPWWSDSLINDTLRMDVTPADDKLYFKHMKEQGKYVSLSDYLSRKWILRNHDNDIDFVEFNTIEELVKAGWVLD